MKKYKLPTPFLFSVCLLFSAGILYHFLSNSSDVGPYRCTTQLFQESRPTRTGEKPVQVSVSMNVLQQDKEGGFFSVTGIVEANNETYNLNRTIYFSQPSKSEYGMKQLTLINVAVYSDDTTPEKLWVEQILPQDKNKVYHIETKRINDNTVMISAPSSLHLLCVMR